MPFNPFLGLGRDPKHLGGIKQATTTYTGNVPSPVQDDAATISETRIVALYAIVGITVNNGTAYGSEVTMQFRVGNDVYARYVIPTGQQGQIAYEVVPINAEILNPNSLIMSHGAPIGGGASNYTLKVTLFYKES